MRLVDISNGMVNKESASSKGCSQACSTVHPPIFTSHVHVFSNEALLLLVTITEMRLIKEELAILVLVPNIPGNTVLSVSASLSTVIVVNAMFEVVAWYFPSGFHIPSSAHGHAFSLFKSEAIDPFWSCWWLRWRSALEATLQIAITFWASIPHVFLLVIKVKPACSVFSPF